MTTSPVTDQNARDNFVKLNRLFGGKFVANTGVIVGGISGFTTQAMAWKVYYARVGAAVTLAGVQLTVASKVNTNNPQTSAPLPTALWPVATVLGTYYYSLAGTLTAGVFEITTGGIIALSPAPSASFTASVAFTIYGVNATYVGT
jgi:hypothetical protein